MNFDVTLNLQSGPVAPLFEVVEGGGITLIATIMDGEEPYGLTDATIQIDYIKPSGETISQTDISVSENIITAYIPPSYFAPGTMNCHLMIGELQISFQFVVLYSRVLKRFQVNLDIKRPVGNREFSVVDGDNGNILEVTITDDAEPINLTSCFVMAVFSKPDGRIAEQDNNGNGITIYGEDGNKLDIELYTTSFSPGLVECEILVFSDEDQTTLITSARFNFDCRRAIVNRDTIKQTDEWPLLIGLMQDVELGEAGRNANEEIRIENENDRINRNNAFSVWEEFTPGKTYYPLNKVAYNGSSYLCIEETEIAPPDANYWLLIAKKGMDGTGTGDMLKAEYDMNDTGTVDDAQRLGGLLPEAYAFKTIQHEHTLEVEGWEDGEYIISDDAIKANSPGDIKIHQEADENEYFTFCDLLPQVTEQGDASVTITARGKVPEIPIRVMLEVRT